MIKPDKEDKTCGGRCTTCKCPPPPANTERFYDSLAAEFKCEVDACHMGPDANVYTVTVRGPDGRQRTGRGCVKHLYLAAGACLNGVRLEPFEEQSG